MWHTRPDEADRVVLAAFLASLNDDRGGDSWGYAPAGEPTVVGLGKLSENVRVRDLTKYDRLFLHTRFATRGEVTTQNCHPFTFGRIRGAHNGAVYNYQSLNRQLNRAFPVDSMHIFAHLDEGLDLADLQGYGAIEWEDTKKPGRIYLAKFDGELTVMHLEGYGAVWSSSHQHLETALKAAGLAERAEEYNIENRHVYYVDDGGVLRETGDKVEVRGWGRLGSYPTHPTHPSTAWEDDYTGYGSLYSAVTGGAQSRTKVEQRNGYQVIDRGKRGVSTVVIEAGKAAGGPATDYVGDAEIIEKFTQQVDDPFEKPPNPYSAYLAEVGEVIPESHEFTDLQRETVSCESDALPAEDTDDTEVLDLQIEASDEAMAEGFAMLSDTYGQEEDL